jgi:protein gp37
MPTAISYAQEAWSPLVGCSHASPGCDNCWAEAMAARLSRLGVPGYDHMTDEAGHWSPTVPALMSTERIQAPRHWRRPRRVFVCPMSDLFHERVPLWMRDLILGEMEESKRHTYLLLTKRPGIMHAALTGFFKRHGLQRAPFNWWLGVSVEDQAHAQQRIPALLAIPAYNYWLSVEPCLGPVDVVAWLRRSSYWPNQPIPATWEEMPWPDWVPDALRQQVAEFWAPDFGDRNPRTWIESAEQAGAPQFGSRVRLPAIPEGDAVGRYVHAWSNMGRIIDDASIIHYVYIDHPADARPGVDWVVVGAESGAKRRPFDVAWAESLLAQCREARVPFYGKQASATRPEQPLLLGGEQQVLELPRWWRR